jgi:hypothetical protein
MRLGPPPRDRDRDRPFAEPMVSQSWCRWAVNADNSSHVDLRLGNDRSQRGWAWMIGIGDTRPEMIGIGIGIEGGKAACRIYLDTMQNLLVRIYKMNNTVNDTCP